MKHDHHWTPESIARFWELSSSEKETHGLSFSRRYGNNLIYLAAHVTELGGKKVLDYGCGPGYLSQCLLEKGCVVTAVETSTESRNLVNSHLRKYENWRGCTGTEELKVQDACYDLIFCVEVIEHLLDADLADTLEFFRQLLAPGGVVVITTPNEENLSASVVPCPECGALFHPRQHVRSWDAEGLRVKIEFHRLEPLFCAGVNLQYFQNKKLSLRSTSLREAWLRYGDRLARLGDMVSPKPFPHGRSFQRLARRGWPQHLIAVAKKPETA